MAVDPVAARKHLEAMLADLDRSIAILRGEHPEPGQTGYDHARRAADTGYIVDADRADASLEALQQRRAEVAAAIERVDDGSYGHCVDCGKPVPEGRLAARPEAARDVSCQASRDRGR
jgi:DnaK suppressor protein